MRIQFKALAKGVAPKGIAILPNSTSLPPEVNSCQVSAIDLAVAGLTTETFARKLEEKYHTQIEFRQMYRQDLQFAVGSAVPVFSEITL